MIRPAPFAALTLALTLLASPPARAAFDPPVPPAGPAGARHVSVEPVVPRSFSFSDLPQRAPGSENIPITLRREHEWEEAQQEVERLKANPPFLPASSFSQFTLDTTAPPADGKGSLSPLAPTLGVGFEGISQGGYIPSEPTVGGGPLNIFSAGNVSVTVTNKDGTNRVETNGETFFGVPAAEGAISDAQCYYDALRGRFVALCFTQGTSPSNFSNFYLAISKTNDARGAWWLYKFDMSKDGAVQTSNWADYQGLGISDDKIVFSSQQFTFAGDAYQYQKLRILDRAAAYSGAALTFVDIANFAAPPGGDTSDNFVTKPARNLTSGDNTIHLLCVRFGGGSRVTYRTLTGPPFSPVLATVNLVSVSAYSAPPDAPQMGSAALVATNDCRPTDFYTRNGVLIVAWHTAATISGTSVSAIRLFRMRLSDRVVLTDETFGSASTFYYYPAVTVDSVGTIFLGFGRSSTTEFPSAYASGKRRTDGSIQPSALLKAGLSATAQSRWGDYTGIDQDASLFTPNSTSAWYSGQWTKGTNTFGTWVNRLSFTYGQVFGVVADDCDGTAATTADRTVIAGVAVALKQGATTVATTTTNALGQYSFGYLESGTYDVVVTPPASGTNLDAVAGTGATTQTRVSASDVQIVMTNAQQSSANNFVVASSKPLAATTSIAPSTRSAGDPQFTLTVDGSDFGECSVVRLDDSDRLTTFVSPSQLTATITLTDQAAGGTRTITVFTPTPGGGTSNGQTLTILGTPDSEAPVVSVTSPAGGENWDVSTVHTITWAATDNIVVASVSLAWSSDGGTTFPNVIATGIANSGSFSWTVPMNLTTTARIRVRAFDGSGNVGSDSSHSDFAITGWTVSANAGANGLISPNGAILVADGATPAFTITPNASYHVEDVLVNGSSVGAVTNFTFPAIHSDQTIAASFAINAYTLTLAAVGSGSVAAVPNQATYDPGTLVQITATPAVGWNFESWSGDATGSTNPLSVTMNANQSITANFSQHIYTWNQTGTASWATATSWTPTRTVPASDDVLIFNNGTTPIATNVPTQTVSQLLVSDNTNVTLQATGAVTLSIAGASGADLSVSSGSTLQLAGANAVTLAIASGATGDIAGTTNLAGAAHRITARDAGSLAYNSGATCMANVGFTGNPFGAGTGTSALNSVEFRLGSIYQHIAGANPFGASAPASVVTFLAGSRYRLDGAITPSMSGRTYADFEYNNAGAQSPTGNSPLTLDSLIITRGTFNLNVTGGVQLRGDIHVQAAGALNLAPASGTVLSLSGVSAQSIDVQGTMTTSSNAGLSLNNSLGVSLVTDLTLGGGLAFTSGLMNTGANTLTLATTSSVTGAGQGSGWVNGNLKKNFATGAFSGSLQVGDASTFAPIDVSGTGAPAGFNLTARTTASDHPDLATSTLDPARSVNRRWMLAPESATGATWLTKFNFPTGDVDAGADPGTFEAQVYNGSAWSSLSINARTSNSTQVLGLTSGTPGTEFAIANLQSFTIMASAGPGGSISPSGTVTVPLNGNQAFTMLPEPGFHVVDVLVDGSSVGAMSGFTFTNVTTNRTIAVSFAGDSRALTVNVVGGGTVARSPDQPSYPHGSTVQLTATPGLGWAFSAWSGDLVSTNNPENLLMNDAKTVTSLFLDITPPTVAVTSPNGADVLHAGSNSNITWTASDNAAVTTIDLELSRAGVGGPYKSIAAGLANTGTFSWLVSVPLTVNALVRATAHDAAGLTAQDASDAEFSIAGSTGVFEGPVTDFALAPVWPNPARGLMRFQYALPRESRTHLSVHDVQGRELLVLVDGTYPAGRHAVDWSDAARATLDPGLYFVRLRVPGRTIVRRFVLMK